MTFWETLAVNVLSLAAGGLLGYGFAELQQFYGKRKEKREAAALIRLESEMNILWLDDVLKSKLWFRDEAFVEMKKRGFISYLPRPLPYLIAQAYDTLYRVNYLTERARSGEPVLDLEKEVEVLRNRLETVNTVLDRHFKSISRNFGPPSSG